MFKSRRRRGSGRSSGKRRKLYWGGLLAQGNGITLDPDSVVSFWIKWPSGLRVDTVEDGVGEVEPCDETWAKCLCNSFIWLGSQSVSGLSENLGVSVTFGAITWDADVDPSRFHETISNDTFPVPSLDYTKDWIIRQPFQFCRSNQFATATTAQFQESRAQRKLPPNTGVIGLLSAVTIIADDPTVIDVNFSIDTRYLLRAGYYQPNTFSR